LENVDNTEVSEDGTAVDTTNDSDNETQE